MARPTKNKTQKNSEVIRFRCTSDEKLRIQSIASELGFSLSDYIRKISLEGNINIQQSKFDEELIFQLKKVGVNLNQQTRKFNASSQWPMELSNILPKIEMLLDHILSEVE